ncbi:hypothetical protein HK405_005079, partial [Cladochytrium tenue]
LLNLRGSDISYNPVFFAYVLVTKSDVYLFVDERKLEDAAKASLQTVGVKIRPYECSFEDLTRLVQEAPENEKLWVDSRCSLALQDAIGGPNKIEEARSPVQTAKAIKNATEIQGFRDCHIRDASALCEYFAWLEEELVEKGNKSLSEVDAADKLEALRSKLPMFMGLSFDTISSTGANGSVIHYQPERDTCMMIDVNKLYLCDSGAQYLDGTTDVTRTMHFGTPSEFEREAFTRVLKGHIQIDMAVFPRGTTGYVLDCLARAALWKAGLDFRHGTGHGVGSFLNVHEGPQGIGTRIAFNDTALEAGMTVSDEPGYYEDGEFGIRIENILVAREVDTKKNFGGRGYLGFEHLTVVPIQTRLVDPSLLTPEERAWLDAYHREVFEKVSPLLAPGSRALTWLERETRPLPVA